MIVIPTCKLPDASGFLKLNWGHIELESLLGAENLVKICDVPVAFLILIVGVVVKLAVSFSIDNNFWWY